MDRRGYAVVALGNPKTGVIVVPTSGCMNLAAAVNVVLYDRPAKQHRETIESREDQ